MSKNIVFIVLLIIKTCHLSATDLSTKPKNCYTTVELSYDYYDGFKRKHIVRVEIKPGITSMTDILNAVVDHAMREKPNKDRKILANKGEGGYFSDEEEREDYIRELPARLDRTTDPLFLEDIVSAPLLLRKPKVLANNLPFFTKMRSSSSDRIRFDEIKLLAPGAPLGGQALQSIVSDQKGVADLKLLPLGWVLHRAILTQHRDSYYGPEKRPEVPETMHPDYGPVLADGRNHLRSTFLQAVLMHSLTPHELAQLRAKRAAHTLNTKEIAPPSECSIS